MIKHELEHEIDGNHPLPGTSACPGTTLQPLKSLPRITLQWSAETVSSVLAQVQDAPAFLTRSERYWRMTMRSLSRAFPAAGLKRRSGRMARRSLPLTTRQISSGVRVPLSAGGRSASCRTIPRRPCRIAVKNLAAGNEMVVTLCATRPG